MHASWGTQTKCWATLGSWTTLHTRCCLTSLLGANNWSASKQAAHQTHQLDIDSAPHTHTHQVVVAPRVSLARRAPIAASTGFNSSCKAAFERLDSFDELFDLAHFASYLNAAGFTTGAHTPTHLYTPPPPPPVTHAVVAPLNRG